MKKLLPLVAAAALAATFTAAALAADPAPPTEVPFPSPKVADLFVAAQTVATDGSLVNYFAPGQTVTFRAYAVDGKTSQILVAKDVKYFYVTIPSQPNVKLKYDPKAPGASSRLAWTGTWTVPSSYPLGIVGFKVLVKTNAKKRGQFVQMPVATSMLTIASNPSAAKTGAAAAAAESLSKLPVALYADSVNGTAPAGGPTRTIGCTQTNVYKRGERFVLRTWGSETSTGEILSSANVDTATFTVPGVSAPINLAWGSHGATGAKVWFWTNFWIVPADYPLGSAVVKVNFKTDSGKTGTYDYPITIIP
ncbi:MAG TPA: hypothetical protein VIU44_03490 [Gaiellaceae bacterium]